MSSPTKESTPTPQEPKQARPRWQPRPPPTQEERYHDEIRNLIYEYSLTYPNALYVVDNLTEPISKPTFHALGL